MINHKEQFHKIVSEYVDLNEKEWELLLTLIYFKTLSKGEALLYEGVGKSDIYIVLNGLLRTYFTRANAEEKTFFFSLEGDLATDYEGMIKGIPSRYSIEAIEPTTIAVIPAKSLQKILSSHSHSKSVFIAIIEKYFFLWSERIADFYMHSPKERYDKMCQRYPDLIQRVPQYLIASYLNISTVHLSRLRRQ